MTTTALTEHTVTVAGKPIFVAETGSGAPVVMLHGGGPGASGVSNYSRNVDALAEHFRVVVPDMPGYGRSAKGVDQSDPFGYLADMIRGLLDELGVATARLIGNSYGGAAALRMALDTPHRVSKLILMGPVASARPEAPRRPDSRACCRTTAVPAPAATSWRPSSGITLSTTALQFRTR
jgi:4,5:9,10-diseco-3-hydroxy-5,9,17-trioxoandrosta-1(10),2-diene-4-oate hydrolase